MTDPFSDARSDFIKVEDLKGRLVLIAPKDVVTRQSRFPGQEGKTYDSVTADVIVLDGPVTESIETIPMTIDDMVISGTIMASQLAPKVKTRGMVLGRVATQPSQTRGFRDAWLLEPPTEADKVIARPAASAYLAANDPFA